MVIKIAHRGASGHAPENTIEAFEKAIALKSDMIELDVRTTKDNIPIIIHDIKINRVTNGKGKIKDLTLNQVKKYKQKNGEKILTLKEAMKIINKRCRINIDIKKGKQNIKEIVKIIEENNAETLVLISSLSKKALMDVKKLNQKIKIGLIKRINVTRKKTFETCKKLEVYSFHPFFKFKGITKRLIKKYQKHDMRVYVWGPKKKKDINKFKKAGVDGIITNYPDRIYDKKK